MSEMWEPYATALQGELSRRGYEYVGDYFAFDKLTQIDKILRVMRFQSQQGSLLATKGCGKHTRNRKFKYEFIIHATHPEKYYLDLLNFAVYFQLTWRDVLPSDVLEIGTSFDRSLDYSHLYVSVPYFLPPSVNFIQSGAITLALSWLMPIRPFEASYIQQHGAEAFEQRLEYFGLDFFADRNSSHYLDN